MERVVKLEVGGELPLLRLLVVKAEAFALGEDIVEVEGDGNDGRGGWCRSGAMKQLKMGATRKL